MGEGGVCDSCMSAWSFGMMGTAGYGVCGVCMYMYVRACRTACSVRCGRGVAAQQLFVPCAPVSGVSASVSARSRWPSFPTPPPNLSLSAHGTHGVSMGCVCVCVHMRLQMHANYFLSLCPVHPAVGATYHVVVVCAWACTCAHALA